MNAIGEMKLGFGEGVAGISPGFMPPPGDAGYGVIPGEQYFWVLQVNNSGTTPVDSEFLERFPQVSNVIGVYYVKGALPSGQLPLAQVIASKDASVKWALPGDNAEVVIQVFQAPPGPGYVVSVQSRR